MKMKKLGSLEQNRVRKPRSGGVRKASVPAPRKAAGVKLTPARRKEPAGLLEEHFSGDGEVHVVTFEYFNPAAREVSVAGSFNGWQPKVTPMTQQPGGNWAAEVLLQPGHHQYRFIVDGVWQDDPLAARFVANSFGCLNCVVEVKPVASAIEGQP